MGEFRHHCTNHIISNNIKRYYSPSSLICLLTSLVVQKTISAFHYLFKNGTRLLWDVTIVHQRAYEACCLSDWLAVSWRTWSIACFLRDQIVIVRANCPRKWSRCRSLNLLWNTLAHQIIKKVYCALCHWSCAHFWCRSTEIRCHSWKAEEGFYTPWIVFLNNCTS